VSPLVTEVTGLSAATVPLVLVVIGLGMTIGNLAGGAMADRSVRRTIYFFFTVLIIALIVLALSAETLVGLLASVFFIGASSSALSPAIQTRLMDVSHDSQSIAAALNHSALNTGNALGAFLGGTAIAAGLGYVAPVWIGLGLSLIGVALTFVTFAIDRSRRRGEAVPYGTQAIRVISPV
jgi:DHA1 family inner membrane transport protein